MKIDGHLILALRTQRSWSQDELAVAAGLNLRTVQRIERSGTTSLHSKKSLAAAFDSGERVHHRPPEYVQTACRARR
ncbi:MAG: helix-turn-helix transcriptional regulator [Chloroflexi bacterium]|nr:helix-turn-helix transcriptional regulator [Chloroflexota bacterium]MDA1239595.1 helix-turn-helix transcriptional regulator [Chloroflexota bacterium]